MIIARIFVFLIVLITLSSLAAAVCNDTDNGPVDPDKPAKFIGIKGAVDYGTGPKEDYCVSRLGGSSMPESEWIREYFCLHGELSARDYRCADYDYASCKEGVCVNYTGTQAALDDVGTPPPEETYEDCGNNKLDGKEQCDPPGKICITYGGGMGTCTDKCKCEKSGQNQTLQNYTQNITINLQNNTKVNTSNQSSNLTEKSNQSDASIVFETQKEEEQVVVENESKQTPTGALPADIQQIIDENNAEASEYMKKPGIRITSAITGFVMKLWSFFVGLIGGG